ncbi:MAG: hypothetical protein HY909_22130 [Deltaproteobacteria bacterium]|nr:hypothetical protein [Deltaproteobacteria bacterium]
MTTSPTSCRSEHPTLQALRALASTRRAWGSLGLHLAAGFGCWTNTLTDHPGYGSALVAGLVGSVSAAVVGAGLPLALRKRSLELSGSHPVAAALGATLVCLGLLLAVVLLRGQGCSPGQGALAWLLVALPGPLLASLVGLWLGASTARRALGTTLAALLVPGFIVWSLVRFYTTPAIFSYDPFHGFYPGAIYDERVPLGETLLTYRVGTLGWSLALAGALVGGWAEGARVRVLVLWRSLPALGCVVAGLVVGLGVYAKGPALGHREGREDIARFLGQRAEGTRCVVLYDRTLEAREGRLLARDCDLRMAQLEAFFGARVPGRVTVFLFASSAQKRALMGAEDTYIAKPWRREVYLQHAPFPHPVLKHELAHVVSGALARGFLRLPVRWGVPLPGLVEGAAVAAAWEGESDATPHQWSRAMLEAGLAPRVRSLEGLGFFGASSLTAYTAAGSFCRWLYDTHGRERFARLYATGDFQGTYGRSLASLESAWHAFLRAVPTDARTLVRARTRFRRASIFGRRCPFDREGLHERAALALSAGELSEASRAYARLVADDPTDTAARTRLAETAVRQGSLSRAEGLSRDAGRDLGPAAEARALLRVADAVWRWQGAAQAQGLYARVDASLFDEDEARTLLLKREALSRGDPLASGVRDLLLGDRELDPSPVASVAALGEHLGRTREPLAAYLVARQLYHQERDRAALALLTDTTLEALTEPRVRAEGLRLRAILRWRLGDLDGSRGDFTRLAWDPTRPQGARDVALDWLDRIGRAQAPR